MKYISPFKLIESLNPEEGYKLEVLNLLYDSILVYYEEEEDFVSKTDTSVIAEFTYNEVQIFTLYWASPRGSVRLAPLIHGKVIITPIFKEDISDDLKFMYSVGVFSLHSIGDVSKVLNAIKIELQLELELDTHDFNWSWNSDVLTDIKSIEWLIQKSKYYISMSSEDNIHDISFSKIFKKFFGINFFEFEFNLTKLKNIAEADLNNYLKNKTREY